MGWGTGVVLVSPGDVPNTGDDGGTDEDNRSVVDGIDSDGDSTGHTEERHGKGGPSCNRVSKMSFLIV